MRRSAHDLKLPANTQGVVVTDVSPVERGRPAGLRRGDVIQEVNRKPVKNTSDFERAVGSSKRETSPVGEPERQHDVPGCLGVNDRRPVLALLRARTGFLGRDGSQ